MPNFMDALRDIVLRPPESIWQGAWREVVLRALAKEAVRRIDFDSAALGLDWDRLDDIGERGRIIRAARQSLEEECLDKLLRHRQHINGKLVGAGHQKMTGPVLRRYLSQILPSLLADRSSEKQLENPFPEMWPMVGDTIAGQVHGRANSGASSAEWRLLNDLLLAAYFHACKLVSAKLVRDSIRDIPQRMLSIRGTFVRIVEQVSDGGIVDARPPRCPAPRSFVLRHAHLSDLLQTTSDEYGRIINDSGIMHRVLKVNDPIPPEMMQKLHGRITEAQFRAGRSTAYRQYEYTLLAYMALSCIEQLLRAWATNKGIDHIRADGHPSPVLKWLARLGCSPGLETAIRDLYGTRGGNVRNRIMHGGLLDVESKRMEQTIATIGVSGSVMATLARQDEYSPSNIANICLSCLGEIDSEIASTTTLSQADLAWVPKVALEQSEVELGRRLVFDFTDPEGLEIRQQMSDYLTVMLPSVGQFVRVGFVGWVGRRMPDALVYFMASMLVFEALYRMTVHLHGIDILQKDPAGGVYQYLMLDSRGLHKPEVRRRLLSSVDSAHRASAEHVIDLTVKARNALAHGGVVRFGAPEADGIGHLLMKSCLAFVQAGIHRMIEEAAYYRWIEEGTTHQGSQVEHWLWAERRVLGSIDRAARIARSARGIL